MTRYCCVSNGLGLQLLQIRIYGSTNYQIAAWNYCFYTHVLKKGKAVQNCKCFISWYDVIFQKNWIFKQHRYLRSLIVISKFSVDECKLSILSHKQRKTCTVGEHWKNQHKGLQIGQDTAQTSLWFNYLEARRELQGGGEGAVME